MKKDFKDVLVIGFALFAMFFGAGNLIFPPYFGNIVGDKFGIASLGFIITGVGIPFLGIIACTKTDGSFEKMSKVVGNNFSFICATALFLAIGPMLGIPRTAATTYELTIKPIIPNISPLISGIMYFAVNLFFILRPSKIIDVIGKYLTPVLLITLLGLIGKGIFFPFATPINTNVTNILPKALIEGYQTMDALGALIFASIIVSSVKSKGYKGKDVISITIKSGAVAIIGLTIIYAGLMYLGAQTSSIISTNISKTNLLLEISQKIFGSFGSIFIGIPIGLACLTTSIGLISAGSEFFETTSKGKLPYKINAILISGASIIIGSYGVDKIVKLSVPILNILYPVAMTLIFLTLGNKYVKNSFVIKTSVYTSLLFSVISTLPNLNINIAFINFITDITPFSNLGFGWLLPTIIVFLITFITSTYFKGAYIK